MKALACAALLTAIVAPGVGAAQAPNPAALAQGRAELAKLSFLDGRWEGEGWTTEAGGQRITFRQTERVGPLLDGGVRLVEGRGYATDGKLAFNAFAVLSPADPGTYDFRSYAMGRAGTFKARLTAPGELVWEIPAGPNKIAYTMTVKDGRWREVGDFVGPDGAKRRFFEMNLRRVGDADWSEAAVSTPVRAR